MKNTFFALLAALAPLLLATPSRAAEPLPESVAPTGDSPSGAADSVLSHFDVEVDPIAYIARGHSLHLGFRASRLRFDVGSFSLQVPEFVHGQHGFEDRAAGYGLKLDVYLLDPGKGPFVGAEGAWFEQEIIYVSTQERAEVSSFIAGGRFGWEFELGAGFYARPWVGLSHRFGNDTVTLPNGSFQQSSFGVFPTVHLGYVFH